MAHRPRVYDLAELEGVGGKRATCNAKRKCGDGLYKRRFDDAAFYERS